MPNKINFLIFIIYFVSLILYQIEAHTALGDMPAPKEHPCYHKNEVCFSGWAETARGHNVFNLTKFSIKRFLSSS